MNVVHPDSYAAWRDTPLGALTERLEHDLVFELAGPLTGRRVLDVGCGDGAYALAAARQGAQVTGMDGSTAMLEAARRRAQEAGLAVRLQEADAGKLPFEDGAFDVVFAVTVLCFVADPEGAVKETARVLAPGGRLVLADLHRWSTWAGWRRVRAWLGSDTWRRATFRSARELAALVEAAGLRVEATRGSVYHPPVAPVARWLAPLDARLGRVTPFGAAFVALSAVKPSSSDP